MEARGRRHNLKFDQGQLSSEAPVNHEAQANKRAARPLQLHCELYDLLPCMTPASWLANLEAGTSNPVSPVMNISGIAITAQHAHYRGSHLLQLVLLQGSLGLLALDLVAQKVHMRLVLLLHPGSLLCLHSKPPIVSLERSCSLSPAALLVHACIMLCLTRLQQQSLWNPLFLALVHHALPGLQL